MRVQVGTELLVSNEANPSGDGSEVSGASGVSFAFAGLTHQAPTIGAIRTKLLDRGNETATLSFTTTRCFADAASAEGWLLQQMGSNKGRIAGQVQLSADGPGNGGGTVSFAYGVASLRNARQSGAALILSYEVMMGVQLS